ncbi:hypothetical protein [Nocardia violaceofusca]|uniref:hypothetical protein n=1 Tax=Nocardia violaceofusca TaxID=941182 RepID=UPI0007A4B2DE|nr:hypothetical protein [Nocardia violaceofusca]
MNIRQIASSTALAAIVTGATAIAATPAHADHIGGSAVGVSTATAYSDTAEPNTATTPAAIESIAAGCTYLPGQPEPLAILERNQSMGLGLAFGLLAGAAAGAGSSAMTLGLAAPLTVPLGMAIGAGTGAALGYNAYQAPAGCVPGR